MRHYNVYYHKLNRHQTILEKYDYTIHNFIKIEELNSINRFDDNVNCIIDLSTDIRFLFTNHFQRKIN